MRISNSLLPCSRESLIVNGKCKMVNVKFRIKLKFEIRLETENLGVKANFLPQMEH